MSSLRRGFHALAFLLLAVGSAPVGAVELRLFDMNGAAHQLSDYAGRWVVVNFWATWCPPCLEEIPELVVFHDKHHDDDAVVLGVNFELLNKGRLLEFADDNLIDYPILPMAPARLTPIGPVTGLPTTYLISPEGEVAKVHVGAITAAQLEGYITELSR